VFFFLSRRIEKKKETAGRRRMKRDEIPKTTLKISYPWENQPRQNGKIARYKKKNCGKRKIERPKIKRQKHPLKELTLHKLKGQKGNLI
jgi:hypothetical protein